MSRTFHWIGIVTLAALLGAAESATKPAVDLSISKVTVDTFARALEQADAPTALAVTLRNEQRSPFARALLKCINREGQLAETMATRFGEAERKRFPSLRIQTVLRADVPKAHRDGDTATPGDGLQTVILSKRPEGEKLEVNGVVQPAEVAMFIAALRRETRATAEVTRQLNAGRYASPDEVTAAYRTLMQAPAHPAPAPATTAPSDR
jgi:hypothetical protein